MSKVSELRLHARNRKLPAAIRLDRVQPELLAHNLYIYTDLSSDPANFTGTRTAEEREDNAVVGVSTGRDVYDLGEFYNQIHSDDICLPLSSLNLYNTRFAMLESGHKIDYHMDPPNIYNIISPLTDPINFETKDHQVEMQVGDVWFVNPSFMHMTDHQSNETRVAILANFNYKEEVYEHLAGIL